MILKLKAIDFKETEFLDCSNCAISKAYKRQSKKGNVVGEGITNFLVYNKNYLLREYSHAIYDKTQFNKDKVKASKAKYDKDVIIREIELKVIK